MTYFNLFVFFASFVLVPAQADTAINPDMLFQSRMNEQTLSWLISKTRVILNDAGIGDGLSGVIELNSETLFPLKSFIPEDIFNKFKDRIMGESSLDLDGASLRLTIPKIGYKIKGVGGNPQKVTVADPYLTLQAQARVSGLEINLPEGLLLEVVIKSAATRVSNVYARARLKPTSIKIPKKLPPLLFGLTFQTIRDQALSFNLISSSFDLIPPYVKDNLYKFELKNSFTGQALSLKWLNDAELKENPNIKNVTDQLEVSPMTVELNDMSRQVGLDVFEPIIQEHLDELLTNVFSSIADTIKDSIGKQILTTAFSSSVASDLVVTTSSLYTRYATSRFTQPSASQIALGITGDVCTLADHAASGPDCTQVVDREKPPRPISDADHQAALDDIRDHLASGEKDVSISVSEEYLNKLLKVTINAGLWEANLKENHLKMGPEGAFLILDKKTETPTLFMDVLYEGEGKGFKKLLVNQKHPLHFPMKISTSIGFTVKNEIPYLVLKTEKLQSTESEIIHGIPKYHLDSKLLPLVKKVIAKMILDMGAAVEGKTALELDLPMFKGVGLEKSSHEVSPYGRFNLYFNSK